MNYVFEGIETAAAALWHWLAPGIVLAGLGWIKLARSGHRDAVGRAAIAALLVPYLVVIVVTIIQGADGWIGVSKQGPPYTHVLIQALPWIQGSLALLAVILNPRNRFATTLVSAGSVMIFLTLLVGTVAASSRDV